MSLFNEMVSEKNHRTPWAGHFLSQVSLSKQPGRRFLNDGQLKGSDTYRAAERDP